MATTTNNSMSVKAHVLEKLLFLRVSIITLDRNGITEDRSIIGWANPITGKKT